MYKNLFLMLVAATSMSAVAGVGTDGGVDRANDVSFQTPLGEFFIDGNFEIDTDIRQVNNPLMINGEEPKGRIKNDQNGRALIRFSGVNNLKSNYFTGFVAEAKINLQGKMEADQAAIFLGQRNNYRVILGRFDGYDLMPLRGDVFWNHAGGFDQYVANKGRGFPGGGGSIIFIKTLGRFQLEFNTLIDKGSNWGDNYLENDSKYAVNKPNQLWMRPVLSYSDKNFSFGIGIEKDINKAAAPLAFKGEQEGSSAVYESVSFDRNYAGLGVGATATLNLSNNSGLTVALESTSDDAKKKSTFYVGGWHGNTSAGVIGGNNKHSELTDNTDITSWEESWKEKVNTIYVSHRLPDFFGKKRFDLSIGAYTSKWSGTDSKTGETLKVNNTTSEKVTDMGVRMRMNYTF